mgnify:CR=1 FL=1
MKKIFIFLLIIMIFLFNAYILAYKYSFFSVASYKKDNHISQKDNLVIVEEKVRIVQQDKDYPILKTYEGTMTAYGANCHGCSGITAYGYDIRNNIYFEDKTFGMLRIVAADKSIPFGTVVRVSGLKVYDDPILAIVLDRGWLIKGTLMDLAFNDENEEIVMKLGRSKVTYDVLRQGW